MPYEITRNTNNTLDLKGRLDAESVTTERERILRKFRSHAVIPGFRKGRAPASVISRRFEAEISEELEEELGSRLLREFLEGEETLQPLTYPEIRKRRLEPDGSFSFEASLEVRPDWTLPQVEEISVEEIPVEVTEEEIEVELENLREEQGTWEPLEEGASATEETLVECNLKTFTGDEEEPHLQEGAQIHLGNDAIPSEIRESLRGAVPGDQRTAVHKRDSDDTEIRHEIEVVGLKRKVLPEIDDEFGKTLGFDTLDELKERIRSVLLDQKQSDRRDKIRRQLLDGLEKDLDTESLPPSLVKNAVTEHMQQFAYSLAMRGEKFPEGFDFAEFEKEVTPSAEKKVMDELVLDQLAHQWEIKVPEDQVEAYIALNARKQGVPIDEYRANLESEGRLQDLRRAALHAAVVSEMFSRAGISEEAE